MNEGTKKIQSPIVVASSSWPSRHNRWCRWYEWWWRRRRTSIGILFFFLPLFMSLSMSVAVVATSCLSYAIDTHTHHTCQLIYIIMRVNYMRIYEWLLIYYCGITEVFLWTLLSFKMPVCQLLGTKHISHWLNVCFLMMWRQWTVVASN